jgi:hypothetical protein
MTYAADGWRVRPILMVAGDREVVAGPRGTATAQSPTAAIGSVGFPVRYPACKPLPEALLCSAACKPAQRSQRLPGRACIAMCEAHAMHTTVACRAGGSTGKSA